MLNITVTQSAFTFAPAAAAEVASQIRLERRTGDEVVIRLDGASLLFDSVFAAARWCAAVAEFLAPDGQAFAPSPGWRSTFAAALAARFREAIERAQSPNHETPEEAMAAFVAAVAEGLDLPAAISPDDALRLARRRLPGWRGRPDLIARKALLFAAQHDPFPHIRVVRLEGGFRIESKVEQAEAECQ